MSASTPEGKVKAHLNQRIAKLGGEVVFTKYIGRKNCPDCRVSFPGGKHVYMSRYFEQLTLVNCWVEPKAPVKGTGRTTKPRPGQAREIQRMRDMGENVLVLATIEAIDFEFPEPA